MGFALKRRLYEGAPAWLRNAIGAIPFGWVAGKHYRRTFAQGQVFERAGAAECRRAQEHLLARILTFATDQVPAYGKLKSTVDRLAPMEALKAFPPLEKEQLQRNLPEYLPRSFAQIPHYEITTGGTSGNQLKLFVDDCSQSVEMAFMHRMWLRVGYHTRCRKATFRGVAFKNLSPDVFWQQNPIYNELQFSPFHISDKNLPRYIEALVEFQPEYLHGYPSAIDALASYVIRQRLHKSLPRIRAILLGSEACYPEQRTRIAAAFGGRPFSWYGHGERIILGGECEEGSTYHQFPDYGYLEILEESEPRQVEEGGRGELVGTGFLNRCFPLIRYRTGDFARRLPSACACGRAWDRFDQVEGRWKQDAVISRTGARISVAALNMHGSLFGRVVRYQYVQKTPGECELRLMVAEGFGEKDLRGIESGYAAKVGDELLVKVCVVEEIPLTARGKLRFLLSEIQGAMDAGQAKAE